MALYTQVGQYQLFKSETYLDNLTLGATLESASTDVETDLNALRSLVKEISGEANWYAALTGRDVKELGTDLTDLEGKKLLFRSQVLTDVTVPTAVRATGTLTGSSNFADTETITIGSTVYTFKSPFVDAAFNVAVGGSLQVSLENLKAAINLEAGAGTKYGTATTAHPTVTSTASDATTLSARAIGYGTVGNTIATTETAANAAWGNTTLTGGAGDVVVLVQASSETPTEVAAVDAGTANGALVKVLTGDVGSHSLAEITGQNALNPKNLVVVRDATTGDPILSGGKTIWGLIQAESGVADGDSFNDTTKQAQISFVRENATADDLEACPGIDIGGKSINYNYVRRINLDAVPEQAFLSGAFVDQSASVDVTLDNAIDNQSGPATQTQSIEWRISDTYTLTFTDSTGAATLLKIEPKAGGDEVTIGGYQANFKSSGNIFDYGATFGNTDTNSIQLDTSVGNIVGNADLRLTAFAGSLYFLDTNKTGSTWAGDLVLSAATSEWDTYEANFGEVSLLNAISQAYSKAKFDTKTAKTTGSINADVNVSGTTGTPNLDANLCDYDGKDITTDMAIYLNGVRLRAGANASANYDVYPGTDPTYGDLKFEFRLKSGDVITMDVF